MNGGERLGLEGMHVHVGRMQLTCGYPSRVDRAQTWNRDWVRTTVGDDWRKGVGRIG